MHPQKFNVCSCHLAKSLECIYRGVVGCEQMRVPPSAALAVLVAASWAVAWVMGLPFTC